jgi:diphthamide synthase (EF-2-diphthine--ammonia ligase)
MMKMIEDVMGGKDNSFYMMYLNWKGNIYVEYAEENYKAEDYFKESYAWVDKLYP